MKASSQKPRPTQPSQFNRKSLSKAKPQESRKNKRPQEDLNYSFQDENISSSHIEHPSLLNRMTKLQELVQKLLTIQSNNQIENQVISKKLCAVEKKLDQLFGLIQGDKQNVDSNLQGKHQRESAFNKSCKGISSKLNFFGEDDSVRGSTMGRIQSRKTNKSLMSIEQRKKLIDREIEKRIKVDLQKRKKASTDTMNNYY